MSLEAFSNSGDSGPAWYLVYTKPRQEKIALENLERQGYRCFLPLHHTQKLKSRKLQQVQEPLFPRYLFVELSKSAQARSWGPIRSTLGVARLVTFGTEAARVHPQIVLYLQERQQAQAEEPGVWLNPGDRVVIKEGPFAGLEAVFDMADGEQRAFVFIELMQKVARLPVEPANLVKAAP